MHTNLAGYQSPLQRNRNHIPPQPSRPRTIHQASNNDDQNQKLDRLMRNAHEVLAKADTVFPFTLFRDTIIVDRAKVTIIKRNFFMMAETFSIRIEDILNVGTTVGPFLGSIEIITRVFNADKPHVVNFLQRNDAIKIKHLIHGYVIATHNNIDCNSLDKEQLIVTLSKLGHEENK